MDENEMVVVNGVVYHRKKPAGEDFVRLREKYDWLQHEVSQMLDRAQEQYDQMREDGLTIGTVEAEGYLRAAKDMQKWVEYIEEN